MGSYPTAATKCQDDIQAILTSFGPVQPSGDVIGQALMYCSVGARFLYYRTRLEKENDNETRVEALDAAFGDLI